jgi:hypothetical protein
MLTELLGEDAHHLYDQLVASGGRPAGDPAAAESTALGELVRRGLVYRTSEPEPHLYAVSPVTAMRRLLAAEQRDVLRAHRRLIDRYAELETLQQRFPPGDGGPDLITGAAAVLSAAHDLSDDARKLCHLLHGAPFVEIDRPAPAGVPHRRLLTTDALAGAGIHEAVEAATAIGAEVRVLPLLPPPMLVTEGAALVPLPGGNALLIRTGHLVESLDHLFGLLWDRATPIGGEMPADGPSPVQLRILRLASTGLKDEAIARSMGRSVRWVRRHFEVLEELLGATNRLTLGIAATRRNWV